MSSLQRYKKSGGFVQLLSLLETFGPQKKEKFLEMIEGESPVWARALREKMLTVERLFTWPDQVVIEVFKGLPPKNMAVSLEGLKEEQKSRLLVFFSPSDKRRLEDAMPDKPKPEEIGATMVKVVELARKMLTQGELRAEKFDEGLLIPEDFEAKLEGQGAQAFAQKMADVAEAPLVFPASFNKEAGSAGANEGHVTSSELLQLQRSLAALMKENKTLKDEVRVMREKLEQIRKIA